MTIAAGYCCINVPHSLVDVQRTNPHKRQLRSFVCGNRQKKPCYSRSAYRAGSEYEHRALTKAHSLRRSACQAIHAAAQQPAGVEPTDDETARHAASQRLLNSLTDSEAPAIACRCVSPGAGLALVADRDIPPGAILLTVPMSVVLMTEDNDQLNGPDASDSPWSAAMALQILDVLADASSDGSQQQQQREQRQQQVSAQAGDSDCSSMSQPKQSDPLTARQHWACALPAYVPLPWAHCEDAFETLEGLGDEAMALEAAAVQDLMNASQPQGDEVDETAWRRAWSLAHSRSFRDGARHFVVPAVDLANHSFQPAASVRVQWNPDNCQGVSASRDVCDEADSMPSAEARIELFANEGGLRAGQEVTINYGPWPNDVWALFYGFVPTPNPHDRVMLFADFRHLADFAAEQFGPVGADAEALLHFLTSGLGGDYQRLFVTPEGFDERLAMAAQKLVALDAPFRLAWPSHRMSPAGTAPDRPVQPADILAARIAQLAMQQQTCLESDRHVDMYIDKRPLAEGIQAAAECVAHRQRLLYSALQQLWGPGAVPP